MGPAYAATNDTIIRINFSNALLPATLTVDMSVRMPSWA